MTHESTFPPRDDRYQAAAPPSPARDATPQPASARGPLMGGSPAAVGQRWHAWAGAALAQSWVRDILLLFVATRLGLMLVTYVGYILVLAPDYSTHSLGALSVATSWDKWDAVHYLAIAGYGYPTATETAFFPLYPLVTHLISLPFGLGGVYWAAVVVSNLAFLGVMVLLYLVTVPLWGGRVAALAVLYLAIFPTAFYFFAPYNESLFLLFVLGCFLALQRRRWALAGALGGLAALTRAAGLFLILPYVVVWWQASGRLWWQAHLGQHGSRDAIPAREAASTDGWRRFAARARVLLPRQAEGMAESAAQASGRGGAPLAALGWALLIPAAQGLYAAYCASRFGDPLAFSHAQTSWNRVTEIPWTTFLWQFQGLFGAAPASFFQVHDALDLAAALFCLGTLVVAWRHLPVAQTLFWAALFLLELSLPGGVASHLNDPMTSVARFALEMFPAFIVLALVTVDRPRWREGIVLCSVMLLATLSLVFILGRWLV